MHHQNISLEYTIQNATIVSTESVATTTVTKELKYELHEGISSLPLSNNQLPELFKQNLKNIEVNDHVVHPVPDGDISFFFCKIKDKTRHVQVFVDSGCNKAILNDDIP